jgi:hypothetical protein
MKDGGRPIVYSMMIKPPLATTLTEARKTPTFRPAKAPPKTGMTTIQAKADEEPPPEKAANVVEEPTKYTLQSTTALSIVRPDRMAKGTASTRTQPPTKVIVTAVGATLA